MIRPCTAHDTDALVGIWLRASLQAHSFIPAHYWQEQAARVRTYFLPQSQNIAFVDDASGQIVGFFSLVGEYLAALFVEPAWQGKGIGSRLLHLALQMQPQAYLTVYAANSKAVAWYSKHGFSRVESRCDAATGQEEWRMCRSLVQSK
ncbi:MAG: GNAT family N-acetyltransferase [Desulfovibrionaceae bacterium]|nr:GNAT family N-acetyltransferase [Desulfovibrionaceae bacterium]